MGKEKLLKLKGQQPISSNDAYTIIDIYLGVNVIGVLRVNSIRLALLYLSPGFAIILQKTA